MIGKLKKKINRKFKDKDFSEIFKKSASGFFISVVGRNLGFVQQLIITNFYGAAALGVFRVCFSILNLVGIFGRFGVDMAMSRFVSQYRKKDRYDLVNEIFQLGIKLVLPIAFVFSLGVFLLAPLLSDQVYHKPYTAFIQIFSVGIFFFILSGVIEEGIRGLKKIKEYSWINNVSTQAAVVIILVVAIVISANGHIGDVFSNIFRKGGGSDVNALGTSKDSGLNIYLVNTSYVVALIFTFALGVYYWFKFVPYKKVTNPTITRNELLKVSLPLLSAKYLTTLYTWLVTIILPAYVTDADIGIFSGAARLTAFATMPLIAVNNITGPRFAEAFGDPDDSHIRKTVNHSTRLIFWTCMPIMGVFFLFPKFLLGFYGPEFITPTAILTFHIINLGQVINFMTGPVTQLLNMTGRQRVTQLYAGISTIATLIFCYILIPDWGLGMGILGAAIATSVGRTVLNLGCSLHIYYTMGINTIYNPFADFSRVIKGFNRKNK